MVQAIHMWGLEFAMSDKYGNISEYKELRKRISGVTQILRTKKKKTITDWKMPATVELRNSTYNNENTLTLIITLTPIGCQWAREGGCTMCGEFESSERQIEILKDPKFHISQFARGITDPTMWKAVRQSGLKISRVRIYQEGNYTNERETSRYAQETIIRLATMIPEVKKITIESRPQYLNEENVKFLSDLLKGTSIQLEIGMGLEAQDDVVRNICINKNGSDLQFKNTVTLLRSYDILPLAYVILKPPFLSEQESIEEAVKTIHFANDIGFSRISLEPMTIHGFTLVDALRFVDRYETPWLWSVIDVLKRCGDCDVKPGVGGIGYFPVPEAYSQNKCDVCNQTVMDRIILYNKHKDLSVFEGLTCPKCYSQWQRTLAYTDRLPLLDRMTRQLDLLEEKIDSYTYKQSHTDHTDGRILYKYVQE